MSSNIILSWSGGKDSALALDKLQYNGGYRLIGLFTVYDPDSGKVAMHNIPVDLIKQQADSLNLEWHGIPLPEKVSNEEYFKAHLNLFNRLKKDAQLEAVGYGDIFLEDIRNFRQILSEKATIPFVYPIWQGGSGFLSQDFISRGFKAMVTAINSKLMPEILPGCLYNEEFVSSLPSEVDIMGENGEFHTFVYDGPMFKQEIAFKLGSIVSKKYPENENLEMKFVEISPK